MDKVRVCNRCGTPVRSTDVPDYDWYCPEHDEDLYEGIETTLVDADDEDYGCDACGELFKENELNCDMHCSRCAVGEEE